MCDINLPFPNRMIQNKQNFNMIHQNGYISFVTRFGLKETRELSGRFFKSIA